MNLQTTTREKAHQNREELPIGLEEEQNETPCVLGAAQQDARGRPGGDEGGE